MSTTESAHPRHELARRLVRTLRKLKSTGSADPGRTELLREVARLSVDLREHFVTPSGEPDWTARTWEYRNFLTDRYTDAGLSKDEARTIQAAVRYHVSKYVRERLAPEQVTALGLRPETSVDRSREQRDARRALLNAARHGLLPTDGEAPSSADVLRALAGALLILQRVESSAVSGMSELDRVQARAVLSRVEARARELSDATATAE